MMSPILERIKKSCSHLSLGGGNTNTPITGINRAMLSGKYCLL